jgi:ppGpp synthetase/RelA/SpoT-type nucleotidyltranferase
MRRSKSLSGISEEHIKKADKTLRTARQRADEALSDIAGGRCSAAFVKMMNAAANYIAGAEHLKEGESASHYTSARSMKPEVEGAVDTAVKAFANRCVR